MNNKGHNHGILNDKRSQFCVMNDIRNNIVNDKKGRNVVNDSFVQKPDGLLVSCGIKPIPQRFYRDLTM